MSKRFDTDRGDSEDQVKRLIKRFEKHFDTAARDKETIKRFCVVFETPLNWSKDTTVSLVAPTNKSGVAAVVHGIFASAKSLGLGHSVSIWCE